MIPTAGPNNAGVHTETRPLRAVVTPHGNVEYDVQHLGIDSTSILIPADNGYPGFRVNSSGPDTPIGRNARPIGGTLVSAPIVAAGHDSIYFSLMMRSEVDNLVAERNFSGRVGSGAGASIITGTMPTPTVPSDTGYRATWNYGSRSQSYYSRAGTAASTWAYAKPSGDYYDHITRAVVRDWYVIRKFVGDEDLGPAGPPDFLLPEGREFYAGPSGGERWYREVWEYVAASPHFVNVGPSLRAKEQAGEVQLAAGMAVAAVTEPAWQPDTPGDFGLFANPLEPWDTERLTTAAPAPGAVTRHYRERAYLNDPISQRNNTREWQTGWVHEGDYSTPAIHTFLVPVLFNSGTGKNVPWPTSWSVPETVVPASRITFRYDLPGLPGGSLGARHLVKLTADVPTFDPHPIRAEVDGGLVATLRKPNNSALEQFSLRRVTREDLEYDSDVYNAIFTGNPSAFVDEIYRFFTTTERGYDAWVGTSPSGATCVVWSLNKTANPIDTSSSTRLAYNVRGTLNYGVYWCKSDPTSGGNRRSRMVRHNGVLEVSRPLPNDVPAVVESVSPLVLKVPCLGTRRTLVEDLATVPTFASMLADGDEFLSLDITEGGTPPIPPSLMAQVEFRLQLSNTILPTPGTPSPVGTPSDFKITLDGNERRVPTIVLADGQSVYSGLSSGWHTMAVPAPLPGWRIRYRWGFARGLPGDSSGPDWIENPNITFFLNPSWANLVEVDYVNDTLPPSRTADTTQYTADTTAWTADRG
jgi:hypothetical protein